MKDLSLEDIIKRVNEMPFMEYDITMCNNDACLNREDCHRHVMYRVYKNDDRKGKPRFLSIYKGNSEKCKMFWKYERSI